MYRFSLILLLAIQWQTASAQLQIKNFFNLTGRKDLSVNVITQDSLGFLWLGTTEGLLKFDGRHAQSVSAAWPSHAKNITALHCAGGRLYAGTNNGKVYVLYKNKLDSVDLRKADITERITSFFLSENILSIGTYGNGLVLCREDSIIAINTDGGLSDNVIYSIEGDGKGSIWCGTDAGINQLEDLPSTPKITVFSSKDGLPDNIVRKIRYHDDKLLLAMQDSGLCYFDPRKANFARDPFFNSWTLGTVLDAQTLDKSLFVATEKQGLIYITNGSLLVFNYGDASLSKVNTVFFDNTQQVWLGSHKGLTRLNEKRVKLIGHQDGLSDDKVLALTTDNNNVIWLGTTKGVSKIMTNDQGKILVSKIKDFEEYTISCAQKAPDGNIWFGTYGNGLLVLNNYSGKIDKLTTARGQLPNDNISHIHFASNNKVYIATLGGGLLQGDLRPDGRLVNRKVYNQQSGLGSDYVYAVCTDKFGKLYAGTDGGGLEVLHNGRFQNVTAKFRLRSNIVFSLCLDSVNNIWAVSNADGLLKFNRSGLSSFTRKNGLRDEQPQQLIASGNSLFLFHSAGIDKIDINNDHITYNDISESELEPNLNAVSSANNRIYSGTNSGVLVYRTSYIAADSAKPHVYINGLNVNFRAYDPDTTAQFSYNQNNLTISFSGVWLKEPEKLVFRYMLKGLDKEWQYSNEGKTSSYNNLLPGSYTFVVMAKNEEDVWSLPATYDFDILSPVWQRWWFWVGVVLIVSASFWLIIQYRLKTLQKENLLLETRVKERTSQIENQSKIIAEKNKELEQLSLVASKTDNVVLILDSEGKLEYVNDSFVRQHNLSCEQVKERYGETIYQLSNNPNIGELVKSAVDQRKSVSYESLNKKAEAGLGKWQSSTLTPIFSDEGELKKIIIIDTDVTERKRQEQIIVQKNKDITDSISYAKKIQHAILPAPEVIRESLPEHFCLYMTKDIVSGDFYWFSRLADCSVIASVDCTGHGVPGAFMSLIGYNALNKIVNENHITDPATILSELNKGVLAALHKNDNESRDGMDIAICRISHNRTNLEYAGAMRPLWIVNNKILTEIKADKIPIGTLATDHEKPLSYTTHNISINKGDRYFIFTDGYADQFGGEKDKKFSTARLKALLCESSHLTIKMQEEVLRNEHLSWKGDHEQIDDILVIGFEV